MSSDENQIELLGDHLISNTLVEVQRFYEKHGQNALPVAEYVIRKMEEEPGLFTCNTPDAIHNIAMEAARRGHRDLERRVLVAGTAPSLFPDDVDLLGDMLQMYCTVYYSPKLAGEIWERLEAIPSAIRDRYWRYWVFGAQYISQILNDHDRAKEFIKKGLKRVPADAKSNILTNFEDYLIDSQTDPDYDSVISALKEGIKEGYPLSYRVATALARILQRRAGSYEDPGARADKLGEALSFLDLAEQLFTGDPRHPVLEIYRKKVDILVGLRNYEEAVFYISAIYAGAGGQFDEDESLKAQASLALHRLNKPFLFKSVVSGRGAVPFMNRDKEATQQQTGEEP